MEELIPKAIGVAKELGWELIPAKPDSRITLFNHTINAMSIADRLIAAYESHGILEFTEREKKVIMGALFVHDFSKGDEDIAEKMASDKLDDLPKRLKGREDVKKALSWLELNENEIEKAIDLGIQMEYPSASDFEEFLSSKPVSRKIDKILRLADRLAGIKNLDEVKNPSISKLAKPLTLEYHKVSVVRGISTQLLHRAVQKVVEKDGWIPILSTIDGTVYIGNGKFVVDYDELLTQMVNEFEEFIDSLDPDQIGSAAFGSFQHTYIKAPEFVFLNDKTAIAFWDYIGSMPSISKPKDLKPTDKKAIEALKTLKPGLNISKYNTLYKLYSSMRYLLMMGAAVLNEAEKIDKKLHEKIRENLRNSGIDVETLVSSAPKHTSPFIQVIQNVDKFLKNLNLDAYKREETINKTIEIFKKSTVNAVKSVRKIDLPLTNPTTIQLLLSELIKPKIAGSDWVNSYETYLKGKKKGTPVCPLCGGKAAKSAVKSLVGDGTESFSNLLSGGSTIGGTNKLKYCTVCELEAKLRSLIMASAEAFYVIPQCIIATNLNDLFWGEAKRKLEFSRISVSDMPSIYDLYSWAEIVLDGNFEKVSSRSYADVFRETVKNAKKNKKIREAINNVLEEYGVDIIEFAKVEGLNVESVEEVVELALKGDGKIINIFDLEKVIQGKKIAVILSSNYVVLLFERLGKQTESETVNLMRKLFAALIISRMFAASVLISEIPLSIINIETPKGAVSFPIKLGVRDFVMAYLSDGWIPFHHSEKLMRKIAALLLLERELSKLGSGSNTLYELTKMRSGEILHKIVHLSGNKMSKKRLQEIFRILKEVGD